MIVPDYDHFFNDEAIKMLEWRFRTKNRIKASKIYKVACRMEKRWRKNRYIPDTITALSGNGCMIFGTSLWLMGLKFEPFPPVAPNGMGNEHKSKHTLSKPT